MKWFWQKEKDPNNGYQIEHYPLSQRYYPIYKGWYLRRSWSKGVISTSSDIDLAEWFNSERHAREFIEKHKEQRGINPINIIDLNNT